MIYLILGVVLAAAVAWFFYPAARPKIAWVVVGVAGWLTVALDWIVKAVGGGA